MEKNEFLVLDEFYIEFSVTRYCLEFIFSDYSLSEKFTSLMAEKYGEKISKNWFFYQKDIHGQLRLPLLGESCFSPTWGQITGLQRTLSPNEIQEAINMVLSVAQEMGIEVRKRNATNVRENAFYGEPLKYQYQTILEPKTNEQSKSTRI